MTILERIQSPADVRALSRGELFTLADEIRARLIDVCSRTGGHIGAGLGVVELTIALHAAFDTPRDQLVWDVGHQGYPHKVLTGRNALLETLRQEGYRAVRAWDPQEALRLARGRAPDLVLLDFNLPYPDGLAVVKQVRNHEATRRAPIVVVAGGELTLSAEESALVDGVVQKPFDIDIMLNAVRKALGDPIVEVQQRQYDAQDYFLHGY